MKDYYQGFIMKTRKTGGKSLALIIATLFFGLVLLMALL